MLRFRTIAARLRNLPRPRGRHASLGTWMNSSSGDAKEPSVPVTFGWLAQWTSRLEVLPDSAEDHTRRNQVALGTLAVLAISGGLFVFNSLPDGRPEKVWKDEDFQVFNRIVGVQESAFPDDAAEDTTNDVPVIDPFLPRNPMPQPDERATTPVSTRTRPGEKGSQFAARVSNHVSTQQPMQVSAQETHVARAVQSAHYEASPGQAHRRGAWLVGTIEPLESAAGPSLGPPPTLGRQEPPAAALVVQPQRPAAASQPSSNSGPLLVPSLNPLATN